MDSARSARDERLERPVVLLARGGSGSRLLSVLARDAGVFVGSELNRSGDSLEMVEAVYAAVTSRLTEASGVPRPTSVAELRRAAAAMLEQDATAMWGFKLPESLLILEEILAAFPGACFVHLIRDPLTTCLRRTHRTARIEDLIGRLTLPAAYRHCGPSPTRIGDDSPALHMAYTTIHQLETVQAFLRRVAAARKVEVRFEDLLEDPGRELGRLGGFLDSEPVSNDLRRIVDPARAASPAVTYPRPVVRRVEQVLAPLRRALGYA